MSIIKIQAELRAPKNQRNNFGNYNYRSAEDILEALKPLLFKNDALLTLDDEMVQVGDRIYCKATATFKQGTAIITTHGWAREEDTKKGMDASQITGACSSYARKYALNAMFLIDDTKDSDATNTHGKEEVATKVDSAFPFPLLRQGETKWLNEGTQDFITIKNLVEKGATLTDVRKHFSVSKKVADKLLEKVKTIG